MASLRSATQQVPGQLDLQNETLGEGESGEGQPRCDFGRVKVRRDWMVYGAAVEGVRPPPPPGPPSPPPSQAPLTRHRYWYQSAVPASSQQESPPLSTLLRTMVGCIPVGLRTGKTPPPN